MPVSSTTHPARLLTFSRSSSSCWCGILSACPGGCPGPLLGVRCWGGTGFRSSDTCPPLTARRAPLLQAGGGRREDQLEEKRVRSRAGSSSHSPQTRSSTGSCRPGVTRGAGGEGTGVVGSDRVDEALRETWGVFS